MEIDITIHPRETLSFSSKVEKVPKRMNINENKTKSSICDGLKKNLRYLNFDNCLINFFIKEVNSGSGSRESE
jgi:hypothetical protein